MEPKYDKVGWVLIRDRALLVSRNHGSELFYLPGGHRIPRETDADVLKREIAEELSLAIEVSTMEHVFTYTGPDVRGDHFRMICYRADYGGTLQIANEIAETLWVTNAEVHRVTDAERSLMTDLRAADLIG